MQINDSFDFKETTEHAVMSCYAADLDFKETTEHAVMSCYAADLG